MSTANPKVLLIGLDGATYDLIKLWVKEKKLPTFSKLLKQGTYGKLKSTIPPHSAIAWVSAFTGKNAGKHGIFYFTDLKGPNLKINTSRDIKSKLIWNLLNEEGKKTIVINVPFTYPPEKINGIMVSGLMTPLPYMEKEVTFPKELKKELLQMNYEIELMVEESTSLLYTNKEKFLLRLFELDEKIAKLAINLMENHAWDTFIVVSRLLDRVQHMFWGYMDPTNPIYSPENAKKYGDYILRSYQKVDALLKGIIEKIDERTIVIVMSDHGSGTMHRYFFINTWLSQQQLLKPKKQGFKAMLTPFILRENLIKSILSITGGKAITKLGLKLLNITPGLNISPSYIDFSKTKVYSPGSYGLLRVNVKGRDPTGTVDPQKEYNKLMDRLIKDLYNLVDPKTGKKVVKRVHRKEELYQGPYVEEGPDLVLETHDKYFPMPLLTNKEIFKNVGEMGNGNHKDNGFIALFGPGIERGKEIEGSHIIDVAPTMLYLQDCPIPSDVDGNILTSALLKSFLEKHPIRRGIRSEASREKEILRYSREEEEEVKERLKSLGYI